MVSKQAPNGVGTLLGFRAVLFRMVSKPDLQVSCRNARFRAVLFRMVSKHIFKISIKFTSFRAVLFRMVSKRLPALIA